MIVAIVGPDGAGKSTATRQVTDFLEARGEPAQLVDRWHIVGNADYPATRFMQASVAETRLCVAEMPRTARFLFLVWSIGFALMARPERENAVAVLDGYWMKHAASEVAYGLDRPWVESVVAGLPHADVAVYLRVTPEVAWERKKDGDVVAYECGMDASCSYNAFVEHQSKILAILDSWAERFGWTTIDAAGDQEHARNAIISALERSGQQQ